MGSFLLKRLGSSIPTLFIVVTLSFFLMRLAPGGPFELERPLDPRVMENLRHAYHLDAPLFVQYTNYLWALLHGDLGPSFTSPDFSVNELFAKALPISLELGALAMLAAFTLGVATGTYAASHRNGVGDTALMMLSTTGLIIPNFVVAPILQLTFGLGLHLLPLGSWNNGALGNIILPVVTLTLPQLAIIARLTRAAMIEALSQPHIRTLRALGLSNATIILHALRQAILPVISYLGPACAAVMTGSIVVENIFSIPGVGRYFVEGALNRDYTVVMGTVVLVATLVIAFNFIVDCLYALLDPRARALARLKGQQ